MDTAIKVGHYEQDGGLVYIAVGFEPSRVLLIDFHTSTNIIFYWWFSMMEEDMASGAQEGISVAEGVTARLADDGGIVKYNSGTQLPSIAEWAASTAYTARSATANGSFVKGGTASTSLDVDGNAVDRNAIFECVTAGTSGSSEPAWPVANGANSASDNGVVWQKVAEPEYRGGYQGFRVAAALQTDGQEAFYEAVKASAEVDHGDVAGWASGVSPEPGEI